MKPRRGRGPSLALRALALVALLAAPAAARTRVECAGGRFLVSRPVPLVKGDVTGRVEAIVVDGGSISINTGCATVAAKVKSSRHGMRVSAAWPSCGSEPGAVRLQAMIKAPKCNTLRGVLRVKGGHPRRRRVRATRAPFAYDVPLDPRSPWPKFRRTSVQDGSSPVRPTINGGHSWTFRTGKGVFSSPVIDADGTVYIGSADRTFYALAADGTVRWQLLTGEIIDSSALLDDTGRVYFGSGDGRLYARDAATGAEAWTFDADPASATGAFISWFEGNVAIGPDGTLYVPNDNFRTYALDRDTRAQRWPAFETVDQTWSLPAVDAAHGRLFLGNNNLLTLLGANTFAIDAATGAELWHAAADGSIPSSPLLTADGAVVLGGFDGFVRAYDQATGMLRWQFGARDHIYASPAALPDGTIVQPAADGTVYALDPATGALRWQFDTRDAIRSSPAVDGDGNVYVGSGEGRLFVLNPDGTRRWAMRLISDPRDDLNASPALGTDAIVIAGESGDVFSIPYDWCLRPEASSDTRCARGPGEDLPDDGASLLFTTRFGGLPAIPPAAIDANQPLAFSLVVRQAGDTRLAHIDSASVQVTLDPAVPVRTEVSGDRKFLTVIPLARLAGPDGGSLSVTVTGQYLVNPQRTGLRFSGGEPGGTFGATFQFTVRASGSGGALPLPVPATPGDPAGVWELSRIAAPLPTILPSYNQIGFDSIHYLVGLVESSAPGQAIAWVVGAKLAEGENRTVVDPATHVLFPVEVAHDGNLLTLENQSGFAIEFNRVRLPFQLFRLATRLDPSGAAQESPALDVLATCSGITFYGPFLQQLGFCNPQTDVLDTFGAAELNPYAGGVQQAPAGVGAVTFAAAADRVTATLTGSTLRPDAHSVAVLLLDDATGRPVPLDYGLGTTRTTAPDGTIATVEVGFGTVVVPATVRAYLMVDAYPAARAIVSVPP